MCLDKYHFWKCFDTIEWNNMELKEWKDTYLVFGNSQFLNRFANPTEIIYDLTLCIEKNTYNQMIFCNTDKLLQTKSTPSFHKSVCNYFTKNKNN